MICLFYWYFLYLLCILLVFVSLCLSAVCATDIINLFKILLENAINSYQRDVRQTTTIQFNFKLFIVFRFEHRLAFRCSKMISINMINRLILATTVLREKKPVCTHKIKMEQNLLYGNFSNFNPFGNVNRL